MLTNQRNPFIQMWHTHKGLTIFFYLSVLMLLVALLGMTIDSREVLGQSTWSKSAKFAMSFILYAPTFIWLLTFMSKGKRWFHLALNGIAIALTIEIVVLIIQAARGQAMHFNISTPLNTALWSIMTITIFVFFGITIVGFILILRQKIADRSLMHSIRWGFAIMLLGLALGFLMPRPTPDQMAILQAGGQPEMIGAHTVGAPDGGPGIPFTGWSTEHGDLRIAHFVGLHGLQVIPLIGWSLLGLSKRRENWFTSKQRLQIVWISALAYLAIVLLVTWQALRGQSIIAPDALTVSVFAAIVAMTTASLLSILRSAAQRIVSHPTTLGQKI